MILLIKIYIWNITNVFKCFRIIYLVKIVTYHIEMCIYCSLYYTVYMYVISSTISNHPSQSNCWGPIKIVT